MTPKFHTLQIADVRRETDDTVSISFHIPGDLINDYHYTAGQYLTLRADVNGEDIRRSYSLCSAPYENEWRVAIKQVENGQFSTFANQHLKAGLNLQVMTPMGHFSYSPDASKSRSILLFAAGSGITPVIAIAKTILKEEPNSDVTLFYGNKGFTSIIFREEIEALKNLHMDKLRVIHVLSRESLGNKIQKGRIDKQKCNDLYKAFLHDLTPDAAYICGPEEMIMGVKDSLLENGMTIDQIHFELFTTADSKKQNTSDNNASESNIAAKMKVILDGDEMDFDLRAGETVLDAALKGGADLPFACKGGVCCTCKAKVLKGAVKMDVNYALEADEVEAGYVLTCQAHPTTEELVVSFDE